MQSFNTEVAPISINETFRLAGIQKLTWEILLHKIINTATILTIPLIIELIVGHFMSKKNKKGLPQNLRLIQEAAWENLIIKLLYTHHMVKFSCMSSRH